VSSRSKQPPSKRYRPICSDEESTPASPSADPKHKAPSNINIDSDDVSSCNEETKTPYPSRTPEPKAPSKNYIVTDEPCSSNQRTKSSYPSRTPQHKTPSNEHIDNDFHQSSSNEETKPTSPSGSQKDKAQFRQLLNTTDENEESSFERPLSPVFRSINQQTKSSYPSRTPQHKTPSNEYINSDYQSSSNEETKPTSPSGNPKDEAQFRKLLNTTDEDEDEESSFERPLSPILRSKKQKIKDWQITESGLTTQQAEYLFQDQMGTAIALSTAHTQLDPRRPEYLSEERIQLITNKSQLLSEHIDAFCTILHRKYPHIGGFYRTEWGATLSFPAPDEDLAIQPVHLPGHWVCVSKGFTDKADVEIYDSLHNDEPCNHLLNVISKLLNCKSSFTYINRKATKQNPGDNSCGVYTLAYATGLAFGLNVEQLNFQHQLKLRDHLKKTLGSNSYENRNNPPHLEPFPVDGKRAANNRSVPVKVEVCAKCGKVIDKDSSNQMIMCDGCNHWFHRKCDNVPEDLFKLKHPEWKCSTCKEDKFQFLFNNTTVHVK
jgi:hypothetical protein